MSAPLFQIIPVDLLEAPAGLPAAVLAPTAAAREQVRRCGQVQPLVVAEKGRAFVVLGGLMEWLGLREAQVQEMICRILGDEDAERRFALRIASDGEAYRESPVMRAWLLEWAEKAGLAERALLDLLPLMGQPAKPSVLQELRGLAKVSAGFLAALHSGLLSLKNLPLLQHLPDKEQAAALALLTRFRFGGSKQRKLLECLLELSLRDNTGVEALLSAWRQSCPPTDNTPQEGQHLLRWLEERANPGLSAAEAAFQEKARRLGLPGDMTLTHTQGFEDDSLTLHIACQGWAELESRLPGIRQALQGTKSESGSVK